MIIILKIFHYYLLSMKRIIHKIINNLGEDILYDNFQDILNFDNIAFFKASMML
jgi:hypothetical protein